MKRRAAWSGGGAFVGLAALTALAGCQVLFGVDASDLVGPSEGGAGGAGERSDGGAGAGGGVSGQGGAAGASGGGSAGQGGAAGVSGGGSAGSGPEPAQDLLATGGYHICVRDHGVARCWGRNNFGQLGIATSAGTETPTPVPALVGDGALGAVRQLALGGSHSCALRDDERVLCWGRNTSGQLGLNTNVDTPNPTPVPTLVEDGALGAVRQLALGFEHSCALRDDGRVLCWGYNFYGQLGISANAGLPNPTPVPTLVEDGALGVVRQLALGHHHSCALRDDGRVLCWGYNFHGQLGSGINMGTETPNPLPGLISDSTLGVVRQLALGINHSCALRDDGRVLCWGRNHFGQLGNEAYVDTDTPNPVPALVDDSALGVVRQLALGHYHSCALRDDGRVLCWGYNRHGQLGIGTNAGLTEPNPVPALVEDGALGVVRQLALGDGYSCALRDDGRVLCWGYNFHGQLGSSTNTGTQIPNVAPLLVQGLPPLLP